MKIPAIIIYSPFVLSLLGGVVAISRADLFMQIVFALMALILLACISLSLIGKSFRYKPWVHVIAAIAFITFSYYLIVLISWQTAGKPGTIFYSGPQKFYHILNMMLSFSVLIAAFPCLIFTSDIEKLLKNKVKSPAGIFIIYLACIMIVITSAAVWYNYLTLPAQEFG